MRKIDEKEQNTEPTAPLDSDHFVPDTGDTSEDDGMVAGGGDSDADTDDTGAESEESEDDESEDDDSDGEDDGSMSSSGSKPPPNREKLEEFRAHRQDLKGMDPLSKQKRNA